MPRSRRSMSVVAAFAAVLSLAPLARAATLHVGWGDSPTVGGLFDDGSDCNTNSGSHTLVVTLQANGLALPEITGLDVELNVFPGVPYACNPPCPPGGPVNPWWQMQPGGCRANAMSASGDFSSDPFASSGIVDLLGSGGTSFSTYLLSPIDAHGVAKFGRSLPLGETVALDGDKEYYLARFTISNTHTTGASACTGCCEPVFFLPKLTLHLPGGQTDLIVTNGDGPASWQGAHGAACTALPVRGTSWGRLKSLYR